MEADRDNNEFICILLTLKNNFGMLIVYTIKKMPIDVNA